MDLAQYAVEKIDSSSMIKRDWEPSVVFIATTPTSTN
jgi:hypothetical protein